VSEFFGIITRYVQLDYIFSTIEQTNRRLMVFCSVCGDELVEGYCPKCGIEIQSSGETKTVSNKKKSSKWYLLPIFLSIVGGITAYLVLRGSDPKKARNCLILGIIVLIIPFAFVIIVSATYSSNIAPEERQQFDERQESKALQKKIDKAQQEIEEASKNIASPLPTSGSNGAYANDDRRDEYVVNKYDSKLSAEELQTVISGFESYNKSVKILLDGCVNVETETDFRLLGLLIAEYGNEFLENTTGYGAVRNKLIDEGYGEHPELGPLMNKTVMLIDQMTTCMDVLAWEFGG
jgi:hypothetical protein